MLRVKRSEGSRDASRQGKDISVVSYRYCLTVAGNRHPQPTVPTHGRPSSRQDRRRHVVVQAGEFDSKGTKKGRVSVLHDDWHYENEGLGTVLLASLRLRGLVSSGYWCVMALR